MIFWLKGRAPAFCKIGIGDLPRRPCCCLAVVRLWFWPGGVAVGGNICIFHASSALWRGPCRRLLCCRWCLQWYARRGARICTLSHPESSCPAGIPCTPGEGELIWTGRVSVSCFPSIPSHGLDGCEGIESRIAWEEGGSRRLPFSLPIYPFFLFSTSKSTCMYLLSALQPSHYRYKPT